MNNFQLKHYCSRDGEDLFAKWLNALRDRHAQARVAARLVRLENGNFGDCKFVGSGVWELRVDYGPGYRVYYAQANKEVILLCEGGDKRTQQMDIDTAQSRWSEWQSRNKK